MKLKDLINEYEMQYLKSGDVVGDSVAISINDENGNELYYSDCMTVDSDITDIDDLRDFEVVSHDVNDDYYQDESEKHLIYITIDFNNMVLVYDCLELETVIMTYDDLLNYYKAQHTQYDGLENFKEIHRIDDETFTRLKNDVSNKKEIIQALKKALNDFDMMICDNENLVNNDRIKAIYPFDESLDEITSNLYALLDEMIEQ